MAVHFKFRSAVEFDSVDVEGPFISIFDLKEKIADHKNLRKCKDFDLVITNAQTGEEYNDDDMLVPKNTSVIIKRVPSARPKPTVVQLDIESLVEASSSKNTNKDDIFAPPTSFNAEVDGFDDFGVDLYAASEQCFLKIDMEESNKMGAMANETDLDRQRQPQGSQLSGEMLEKGDFSRAFSRGHFIKHCSTNGDPAYDMKRAKEPVCIPKTKVKEDQEGLVMQPDEIGSAKEADAILLTMKNEEPPLELRCSICKAIFREAVMIPCCQYSFCNECICQVLIEKGKCPQCTSTKFKNDNLLPNIALRQAIEHFLESQTTISRTDNCAAKHAPDGESAIQVKTASHALPHMQGGLQPSQSPSATVGATEKESNQAIVESAGLSEGKKSVVDNGEGGKVSKVPQLVSHKEQGVTMQSEVSKGKRKRKPSRIPPTDGAANFMACGKVKKGDRCCYLCGSPEHLAKDCMECSGPYPQHGTFRAGGPMYPGSVPAYGLDPYWHGPSVPHVRPFPNMYGPTPAAMPFEAPMVPVAPYAVPPYMPSMYAGVPIHCGFMRVGSIGAAMMTPAERPLSREEFIELQERERWRRLMQEQQDRERVQEKAHSTEGDSRVHCLETEKRLHDQQWGPSDEQQFFYHKCEVDRDSVGNCSDGSDFQKSRSARHIRNYSREKISDSNACERLDSLSEDEDNASFNDKGGRNLHSERWHGHSKAVKSNSRKDSRHYDEDSVGRSSAELEKGDLKRSYSAKAHHNMPRESEYKLTKHGGSKKHSERRIMHCESASPSSSHISCHRSRKGTFEDQKQASCHERDAKRYGSLEHPEGERFSQYNYYSSPEEKRSEGKFREVEKHRSRHHQKHRFSKSEFDPCFLGEESKRRKKYRKHQGNSQDRVRDAKGDVVNDPGVHISRHCKHKSKSSTQWMTSEDPIDESRWPMDMGLDIEGEDVCYLYPSSDKHDDLYIKTSD